MPGTDKNPREHAARVAMVLRGAPKDSRRKVAEDHRAIDVLERYERVQSSFIAFARENHLIANVYRRLLHATRDERSWLGMVFDGMRKAFVDSKPWQSRDNPDVSQEEAKEILADLESLPTITKLRVGWFLAEGLPTDVPLDHGRERAVIGLFRDFVSRAKSLGGDAEGRKALEIQVRLEQDFFRKLDLGRSENSDAGTALSDEEMLSLVALINKMQPERSRVFLDALAAICLTPFGYTPEAPTGNATAGGQEVLADRFWKAEVDET